MFTRESAKQALKSKGWNQRTAAPYLGVTYQHLCLVLSGKRESRRIIKAIRRMPKAPTLQLKDGK
jgi:hypothetical protein